MVFGFFNPRRLDPKTDLNRPVNFVNWIEADKFCSILTEQERTAGRLKEGYEFRLPTEIEWEYACRAGENKPFGIGDGWNLDSTLANFDGAYPFGESDNGPTIGKSVTVGLYEANTWGLHDMHGNVWEWCLDSFTKSSLIVRTGTISSLEITRTIRGGGWTSSGRFCRATSRLGCPSTVKRPNLGFRVVIGRTEYQR